MFAVTYVLSCSLLHDIYGEFNWGLSIFRIDVAIDIGKVGL